MGETYEEVLLPGVLLGCRPVWLDDNVRLRLEVLPDPVEFAWLPTKPFGLNALVVLAWRTQDMPPRTWPMNRSFCRVNKKTDSLSSTLGTIPAMSRSGGRDSYRNFGLGYHLSEHRLRVLETMLKRMISRYTASTSFGGFLPRGCGVPWSPRTPVSLFHS